jgi:hypothetical protein
MHSKITGKEQGKCPVCMCSAQSCVPSTWQRPLLPLENICVAHGLHMIPQRDHRYGYFRLVDSHMQDEVVIGCLRYGAWISAQVPLVGYNPRENHWRLAHLHPGEDQKFLKHDHSQHLPPPTGMSAKHVKAWGLEPEGEVEIWTPVLCDPSPEPQAGPSRQKAPPPVKPPSRATRKCKMASPSCLQPPRKHRTVIIVTVPPVPSPAPSAPLALRDSLPDDLFSPLRLLETLTAPDMPLPLQQQLVNSHFKQLVMSLGIIQSSINSWNSQVRALCAMGQHLGFVSPVEEVWVVSRQEVVEWKETPVDPHDHKGKKPALRPCARKGKKTPSEVPESGDDGPEDPHHGKGNGKGGNKNGGNGAIVV